MSPREIKNNSSNRRRFSNTEGYNEVVLSAQEVKEASDNLRFIESKLKEFEKRIEKLSSVLNKMQTDIDKFSSYPNMHEKTHAALGNEVNTLRKQVEALASVKPVHNVSLSPKMVSPEIKVLKSAPTKIVHTLKRDSRGSIKGIESVVYKEE